MPAQFETFLVTPDEAFDGTEWEMFVRAQSPRAAIGYVVRYLREMHEHKLRSLKSVRTDEILPRGEKYWIVQELPGLSGRKPGIVEWSKFKRTQWVALYD